MSKASISLPEVSQAYVYDPLGDLTEILADFWIYGIVSSLLLSIKEGSLFTSHVGGKFLLGL